MTADATEFYVVALALLVAVVAIMALVGLFLATLALGLGRAASREMPCGCPVCRVNDIDPDSGVDRD